MKTTDIADFIKPEAFLKQATEATTVKAITSLLAQFPIVDENAYLDGLVSKKADEHRLEEKKTKYTSHVAYHLYQMYLHKDDVRKRKEAGNESEELHEPQDEEMQLEINRVASTLIRLMEVMR